jgi:hypothetical protein
MSTGKLASCGTAKKEIAPGVERCQQVPEQPSRELPPAGATTRTAGEAVQGSPAHAPRPRRPRPDQQPLPPPPLLPSCCPVSYRSCPGSPDLGRDHRCCCCSVTVAVPRPHPRPRCARGSTHRRCRQHRQLRFLRHRSYPSANSGLHGQQECGGCRYKNAGEGTRTAQDPRQLGQCPPHRDGGHTRGGDDRSEFEAGIIAHMPLGRLGSGAVGPLRAVNGHLGHRCASPWTAGQPSVRSGAIHRPRRSRPP